MVYTPRNSVCRPDLVTVSPASLPERGVPEERAQSGTPPEPSFTFYLGTHMPHWLREPGPWFVSITTLRKLKKWPRASGKWSLDSGAFSEISKNGKWLVSTSQYVEEVKRAQEEIGQLEWCAPQDWMCEPFITAKTGLDVSQHQRLTTDNFLALRARLGASVIPVLQGWGIWDYIRHNALYTANGVDLRKERIVGVGSICRRQHMPAASMILALLKSEGIRIHAFGLKLQGLRNNRAHLVSSDSMSWSFDARRTPHRLNGHTHLNCANCLEFAQLWREKVR